MIQSQEIVLSSLRKNGPMTVTQICNDTGCSPTYVRRSLKKLAKYKFVEDGEPVRKPGCTTWLATWRAIE